MKHPPKVGCKNCTTSPSSHLLKDERINRISDRRADKQICTAAKDTDGDTNGDRRRHRWTDREAQAPAVTKKVGRTDRRRQAQAYIGRHRETDGRRETGKDMQTDGCRHKERCGRQIERERERWRQTYSKGHGGFNISLFLYFCRGKVRGVNKAWDY